MHTEEETKIALLGPTSCWDNILLVNIKKKIEAKA